jgi:hypothetical protein
MARNRSLDFYCRQATGEFVFCKYFGIPFEPDSEGRFDVLLDGVNVEIEPAMDASNPVVRFERRNDFRKDITVLTSLDGHACELVGWLDRGQFRRLFKECAALGFGVRPLVLDRTALRPIDELRDFVRGKRRAA